MDALEAMKNEGNALFQQKLFAEAVRVYTSILDQLQAGVANEATARLENAVRLNRAWAWIQIPEGQSSKAALAAAELDCSAVIEKDASCVKALYRRALVRERRGLWMLAREDAAAVRRLEPANPFIAPLLERLQQHSQVDKEDLVPKLQRCLINSSDSADSSIDTSTSALAGEKEDAWCALQAAEIDLQKVYKSVAQQSSMAWRKPRKAQKNQKTDQKGLPTKAEILQKTDDLWESLRQEEITTVAKAFPRLKKGASVSIKKNVL